MFIYFNEFNYNLIIIIILLLSYYLLYLLLGRSMHLSIACSSKIMIYVDKVKSTIIF